MESPRPNDEPGFLPDPVPEDEPGRKHDPKPLNPEVTPMDEDKRIKGGITVEET